MPARRKFLDQKLVTEFAQFRALKNKIEKWLEACRDQFLDQFKSGAACPVRGPFLLVVEPGQGRINWQQEFFSYLERGFKAAGKSDEEAQALAVIKMAEVETAAERKPTSTLSVKPNPSYSGKAATVIVKKLDSRSQRGF